MTYLLTYKSSDNDKCLHPSCLFLIEEHCLQNYFNENYPSDVFITKYEKTYH
jgi:hypothetical protein